MAKPYNKIMHLVIKTIANGKLVEAGYFFHHFKTKANTVGVRTLLLKTPEKFMTVQRKKLSCILNSKCIPLQRYFYETIGIIMPDGVSQQVAN